MISRKDDIRDFDPEGYAQAHKGLINGTISFPSQSDNPTEFFGSHTQHTDQKPTNPKDALGSDRAPLTLVSGYAEAEESLAMAEGGLKYGFYNYRGIGVRASIYLDAAKRHIRRYQNGEDRDPKTDVHHLGSARACLGIIFESIAQGNFTDDRPPQQPAYMRLLDEVEGRMKHLKKVFASYAPKHWTIEKDKE